MSDKIRNILEDPFEEDVCLNDVVMAFVGLSDYMSRLEYENKVHYYKEASKELTKAKKKFQEFEHRFRNEIRVDVIEKISRYDKRVDPKKPDDILPSIEGW
jgi:hypothetical protein